LRCADNNLGTSWCHCFYLADHPTPATDRHLRFFDTLKVALRSNATPLKRNHRHAPKRMPMVQRTQFQRADSVQNDGANITAWEAIPRKKKPSM
jgi:hypothetical protein